MKPSAIHSVSLCIATFNRPNGLERTLRSLGGLNLTELTPGIEIEIVVVDNDPQRSAETLVKDIAESLRWDVVYVHEPRRGISFARNSAIEASSKEAIAFIDDDEEASPNWLAELLKIQASTGALAITGPVLPLFEKDPPAWAVEGRFFERPRHPSGTPVSAAGTGNLLLHGELLDRLGPRPFEETMALTGGEDTLLSMCISESGHQILWCDEAILHEWNPPSRVRRSWLIKRSFRGGATFAHCEAFIRGSLRQRTVRFFKGAGRLVEGLTRSLFAVIARDRNRLQAAVQVSALGAGMMVGAVGIRYREYRRTH